VDQVISWVSGLDLKGNGIKNSFSIFGVFQFVDGVHGVGVDGKGGN